MKGFEIYNKRALNKTLNKYILKGEGIRENPYIIESDEIFPQKIFIKSSRVYFKVKNCNFKSLILKNCSNVSFHDCNFNYIALYSCHDIRVANCNIEYLVLNLCYKNNIEHCLINKISSSSSRGNQFTNNKIPDFYKYLLNRRDKVNYNMVIILFFSVLLIGLVLPFSNSFIQNSIIVLIILVCYLLILASIIFMLILPIYLKIKRIRKFPLNKIE